MTPVRSVYGDKNEHGRMQRPIGRGGKVTSPFGRPRDVNQVRILTVATLTLYNLYVWSYAVFKELRRLHGRRFPLVRYIVGILVPPVLFTHIFLEVGELEYFRHGRGLEPGTRVGPFMGFWLLGATILVLFGTPWALGFLAWGWGLALFLVGLAGFLALHAWIYGRVQEDVNGIWHSIGVNA